MFNLLSRTMLALSAVLAVSSFALAEDLRVGFAEKEITPEVGVNKPVVWLAGYGYGRKATGVHDPLFARVIVLDDGEQKIALAAVDLVGLQYEAVLKVREQLKDFRNVTVSSTHNHEGPDVIGIWGESPFKRGVNDDYLQFVIDQTVGAIRAAEKNLSPATATYGMAADETLLDDSRLPYVKDGVLRALKFTAADKKPLGILVQWNCHPESLGAKNTLLTADFPGYTGSWLKAKHDCPVVYLSGAVGGLMAPPDDRIRDDSGKVLADGDFEYARRLGEETAQLADRAIATAEPIRLTPISVAERRIAVPVKNRLYRLARQTGVLKREGRFWLGNANEFGEVVTEHKQGSETAIVSEVSCLSLGELAIANVPGELYPELVYGKFQEPVDPAADFADSPLEPTIVELMPSKKWLLLGLANDELGYLIPKRQWDEKSPFCYGRTKAQYGEINSCGPDSAPIVMKALSDCVQSLAK